MTPRLFCALLLILCIYSSLQSPQAQASDTLGLKEIKYSNDTTHHVIVMTNFSRDKSARCTYSKPLCQAVEENSVFTVKPGQKDEIYLQFSFEVKNDYEKPVKLIVLYTISEHRKMVWESIDSSSRTILVDTRCQVSGSCRSKPLKLKERTEYRVAVRYVMDDDEAYRALPIITIDPVPVK